MIYKLFNLIQNRKIEMPDDSYTAFLFSNGEDSILKKIGEEAMEVILAAKAQGNQRLVEEVADLFYHTFVLLVEKGIPLDAVEMELTKRHQAKSG